MKPFVLASIFQLLLALLLPLTVIFAQGYTFPYQAVVRNADGIALADEVADFTFRIVLQDSVLYEEIHPEVNSGPQGIINLGVGGGEAVFGDMTDIPWYNTSLELEVYMDENLVTSSKMVAVPVALYAQTAGYSNWAGNSIESQNAQRAVFAEQAGKWLIRRTQNSELTYVDTLTSVGIGTDSPNYPLDVRGEGIGLRHPSGNQIALLANFPAFTINPQGPRHLTFGFLSSREAATLTTIGENGFATFGFDPNGRLGINTDRPTHPLTIRATSLNRGIYMYGPTGSNSLHIYHTQNSAGVDSPAMNMGGGTILRGGGLDSQFKGRVVVDILRVNGADMAELCHGPEDIQPGEVVVLIDGVANTAERSREAYDGRALGVICGAGGLRQGIEMAQDGVMDGNLRFAVAGRVWVQTTGKVVAGDLLTTSTVAGKAMAARSRRKAFGKTLGVALTPPNEEGLVLMLVNRN